jgi:hypothetical protein
MSGTIFRGLMIDTAENLNDLVECPCFSSLCCKERHLHQCNDQITRKHEYATNQLRVKTAPARLRLARWRMTNAFEILREEECDVD